MTSKKILFLFNHKAEHEVSKIQAGQLPSDRLYGFMELRELGWKIDLCDERITRLEMKLRKFFLWINFKTLYKASKYDVWLVKDQFSLTLTMCAFIMRKKLIYIDSLFHVPKNPLRKFILYINTKLAPLIVTYSHYQVDLWSKLFNLKKEKFVILPYTIDPNFYLNGIANANPIAELNPHPYVLATGRDTGRDFSTLVKAAFEANLDVRLVTLPYLVPKIEHPVRKLYVHENISYPELFGLYKTAAMVAVPLKKEIVYPSGIRAVLEGLLSGKPVICSTTPVLDEYAPRDSECLFYVEPEDIDGLKNAFLSVQNNRALRERLIHNGKALAENSFSMNKFTNALNDLLLSVTSTKK